MEEGIGSERGCEFDWVPESEAPSLQPELRCRLFETRIANSLEIPIGRGEARRGEASVTRKQTWLPLA